MFITIINIIIALFLLSLSLRQKLKISFGSFPKNTKLYYALSRYKASLHVHIYSCSDKESIKKIVVKLRHCSHCLADASRAAGGARQGHAPFVLFVIWISKIEIIFHFDFLISFFLWVDVIPSSTFIEHGGIGEIWHFWLFYFFLTCLCVWRVDSVSAWLRYLLSGVGRLSAISKQSKSTMHSVIISIKSTVITLVFSSNITSLQTMIYWVCYLRRTGGGPFLAEISRPVNVWDLELSLRRGKRMNWGLVCYDGRLNSTIPVGKNHDFLHPSESD